MLKQCRETAPILKNVIALMIAIAQADHKSTAYGYDLSMAQRLLAEVQFHTGSAQEVVESINKVIGLIRYLKENRSLRDADQNLLSELQSEKRHFCTGKNDRLFASA